MYLILFPSQELCSFSWRLELLNCVFEEIIKT
uniref:Uncharacterized protein n=1 Tax=Anguilla anguilla TaxID=7936 RepID=A0A0E9R9E2_ANGAN